VTNADKKRLGHELLVAAFDELRARVHLAAGRAMASTLLNKPEREVTNEEAEHALAAFDPKSDDPMTWGAGRAGVFGAVWALRAVVPDKLTEILAATFQASEDGGVRGLAVPVTVPKRGSGKPARYGPPSQQSDVGRWLAREVGFQTGLKKGLSFDAAVGLVTGVTRNGKSSQNGPPLLPLGGGWNAVRSFAARSKADNPEMWTTAEAADFVAEREEVLALARNAQAWRRVLRNARLN
jgi:hypothetical protein